MMPKFQFLITATAVALAVTSTGALAQVNVLVRDDATGVVYKVNEPDGLNKAKEQAARMEGTWRTLLAEDRTCGGGAIWYASNRAERKYFLVTGKATSGEANIAAAKQARAFTQDKPAWIAGALRTWLNRNAASAGGCSNTASNGSSGPQLTEPEKSSSDRGMDYIKSKVRDRLTESCEPELSDDGKSAQVKLRMPSESGLRRKSAPGEPAAGADGGSNACKKPKNSAVGARG